MAVVFCMRNAPPYFISSWWKLLGKWWNLVGGSTSLGQALRGHSLSLLPVCSPSIPISYVVEDVFSQLSDLACICLASPLWNPGGNKLLGSYPDMISYHSSKSHQYHGKKRLCLELSFLPSQH